MSNITLAKICSLIEGESAGDLSRIMEGALGIEEAGPTQLSFISNPVYLDKISKTKAGAVLVKHDISLPEVPNDTVIIRCKDPYLAFCMVLTAFFNPIKTKKGIEQPSFVAEGVALDSSNYIGAFAYISAGVKLGKGVQIYPHCFIGEDVEVGAGTIMYAGTKVYAGSIIGDNCIIHAGVVIGSDGFGHAPMPDGSYAKIPQIGKVIIENDVEIGANTTIDRATLGTTVIEKGCKLDNLIQIGHNARVGYHTVIAAQTGVAGSTSIGNYCMIGGQVGFAGHLKVADKSRFGAQTGVATHIKEPGKDWLGTPAIPYKDSLKSMILHKKLPEIEERLRKIEHNSKQSS
jgi:UDP-3-O-[3-hydroxymyristoyl] glucosamine N-acyltransferase